MALKDKLLNGIGLNKLITNIKNLVKPNPALAGTESDLTGLEVNGIKYAVPQVEANPTIPSGTTPTALEGLKVGSDYFSAGGGDVHLYQHSAAVAFVSDNSGSLVNESCYVRVDLISDIATPFTMAQFQDAIGGGNFTFTGHAGNTTDLPSYCSKSPYDSTKLAAYFFRLSGSQWGLFQANVAFSSLTLYDTVTQIL